MFFGIWGEYDPQTGVESRPINFEFTEKSYHEGTEDTEFLW